MNLVFAILLFLSALSGIGWYWISHKATIRGKLAAATAPLIIFDFDGTICPSYPLLIEQINLLAKSYRLRKIKPEEVDRFREMEPRQVMEFLGISSFKLPFVLRKIRRNIQKQLLELAPVPGLVDVLRELKRRGYRLGILTSNSAENVSLYLQAYEIDLFDFIYAANNVFGKASRLKAIVKKACTAREHRVVYVGDEIRDIAAARKAEVLSVGVTWGYNSAALLQSSHPDFLCKTPSEIKKLHFP